MFASFFTSVFLAKLISVPLLTTLISWAQQRWGQYIAGMLYGLPVVGGPVSIFLAIEQGIPFAAHSAIFSIAGMLGFFAYSVTYLEAARRLHWSASVLLALTVCFGIMAVISAFELTIFTALLLAFLGHAAYLLYLGAQPRQQLPPTKKIPYNLTIRASTSVLILLLVTAFADVLGPDYAGLAAVLPIGGVTLYIFTHAQNGRDSLVELARGAGLIYFGFISFFAAVYFMGDSQSIAYVYAISITINFAISWLAYKVQQRIYR